MTAFDGIDVIDIVDEELICNTVTLEKLNHTYASSYIEALKVIQDVEGEEKLA
ncbi:hypothetical protein [Peribacillus frigoritolerans]|uniref:hypothetical protein n=1 Tax=Peribacillus frigoritolerans TaxID=450367 RepID=UPI002230D4EF|nr:hypothetical protein [Peribacillus frigoritolerans]UZD48183.1 hypothetical protein OMJ04_06790 [Peribacillus frigoritolerans]